jgi:hypothetical protein
MHLENPYPSESRQQTPLITVFGGKELAPSHIFRNESTGFTETNHQRSPKVQLLVHAAEIFST